MYLCSHCLLSDIQCQEQFPCWKWSLCSVYCYSAISSPFLSWVHGQKSIKHLPDPWKQEKVGGSWEHTGVLSFVSVYFLTNYFFFECPLEDSLENTCFTSSAVHDKAHESEPWGVSGLSPGCSLTCFGAVKYSWGWKSTEKGWMDRSRLWHLKWLSGLTQ